MSYWYNCNTLRSTRAAELGWPSIGITEDSALLWILTIITSIDFLMNILWACMAFWKTLLDFDRYLWNVMTFSHVAEVELEMSDCFSFSCPTPCHLWHPGHLLLSSVSLWRNKNKMKHQTVKLTSCPTFSQFHYTAREKCPSLIKHAAIMDQ